ncbi:MAG: hypothetical protein IMF11_18605 [Proteobacteria bacterium]|nr:hypothetical protein [Pseudomonadota bacterium]
MAEYIQKERSRSSLLGLVRLADIHKSKMILSGIFSFLGEGCGIVPFVLIYYIIMELTSKLLQSKCAR